MSEKSPFRVAPDTSRSQKLSDVVRPAGDSPVHTAARTNSKPGAASQQARPKEWLEPLVSLRTTLSSAFTPGNFMSPEVMARICLILACFALVSFTFSTIAARWYGIAYSPGITLGMITTAAFAFMGVRCALAGSIPWSFASLTAATCMVQITGAFIAGYGIHAPALMTGLVSLMLGYLNFPRRYVMLWGGPTVLLWLTVFICHVTGLVGQNPITPQPLPLNVLLNMAATLATILTVVHMLANQAERSFRSVQTDAETTSRSLQIESQTREGLQKFIGHLSHEIRNPVAALRNSVTLLNHPNATPAIRERSIRLVDDTSKHLLELLNDALDSLKYGDQSFALRQQPFELNAVLSEVVELFASSAAEKGLYLHVDMQNGRSGGLTGDPQRLRQMLSNLVSNAIKFTTQGEICIRVVAPQTAGSLTWRFEVSDTGPGISEADREKLFKPFSQLHESEKVMSLGTGLGLTIVNQLATAMNGRTGVLSEAGKGSTFWFEVQLAGSESS